MNRILFYYDNYCGESARGGTEVATSRVARALKEKGYRVYNAYLKRKENKPEHLYDDTIKLPKAGSQFIGKLAAFIREHEIEVIINEGRFFRQRKLKAAIEASGRDVKLVFMHHFAPGSEKVKGTWKAAWRLLRLDPANPVYYLRLLFYPLFKLPRRLRLRSIYNDVYKISDAVTLLSPGYIDEYRKTGNIADNGKFTAIPNIFDGKSQDEINGKEKRVLILSRMDEIQKRISLALKIWKKIEQTGEFTDWHLDIVGNGHEMRGLRKLARRLRLKNVTFYGWDNSRPHLRRSAILMMTSLYEGLSLSMIEAQTAGCVPIAFDSYASLRDIVTDGETGIIVEPFGDLDRFASQLSELMRDGERRTRIAKAAAKSASEKFTPEVVALQWEKLLNNLSPRLIISNPSSTDGKD